MNEMTPIHPDLAEVATVGNRQALLLPEDLRLLGDGPFVVERYGDGLRLFPYVEEDWNWATGLSSMMADDWARAIEAGRIGPDHPDNALDDEPTFD